MDFIYVAAPALMTFLFAYFAVNTDRKENPHIRNLFFLMAILSLLIFVRMAQTVSVYGEVLPDTDLTAYSFDVNGTLLNSSSVLNYTHVSPVQDTDYDNIWFVALTLTQVVFLFSFLKFLEGALAIFRKKEDG